MAVPLPLLAHFSSLEDPRVRRSRRHNLLDIVGLTVCAVLGGADDIVQVQAFGDAKAGWLRRFLELPNGIPSHDTIGRVLARLDPERFAACFSDWVAAFAEPLGARRVAIDGKALRGSRGGTNGKTAFHMVSAWAADARLTLGIAETDSKSNEITAIPKLLEILDLRGALVTIDAMGCQKEIAQAIREAEADYVLAAKDNQPRLHEDIQALFAAHLEADMQGVARSTAWREEAGHGRQEMRTVVVFDDLEAIRDKALWKDLACVAVAVRERTAGGKTSCELSCYISSRLMEAKEFAEAVRGHWGIENGCHWVLDVCFREDASRLRTDHAPANMACIRRMALAMLGRAKGAKGGAKTKRLRAGWDTMFLEQVLQVDV